MRSYPFPLSTLFTALSLALALPAVAQQNDATTAKDQDIEVITVSPKGLISYVSAAASKSDVPIVKTPVSVSVLTATRIADLGAETLQDAIGYVAGVYNGPYGVDTRGDWSKIRGVDPIQYLDGLQRQFGHYNNTRPNPYGLESIEILKGPSSVLYGQGSTGGIVNAISKQPKSGTFGEVWAQLGNYERKQLALDYNTELLEDELQTRVVAMFRQSGTQTDYVDDNTLFFAPSLAWQASDDTKITLLGNLQRNQSGSSTQFFPHQGTLLEAPFGQIPSERFVSEPGWDKYDTEQAALTAILVHQLDEDSHVRFTTRYSDSESDYRSIYAWPPKFAADNRTVKRVLSMQEGTARSWLSDLQYHSYITLGNTQHNIVLGVDHQDADTDTDRASGTAGVLDLYAPVYGLVTDLPSSIATSAKPRYADTIKNQQLGVYIQDTFEYEQWVVNLAVRHDNVTSKIKAADPKRKTQQATTGRVGVVYQWQGGLSPYASYSESFKPILGEKPQGGRYEPQQGKQVEVGVKYQPTGTEHLITAALFEIKDENQIRRVAPDFEVQDSSTQVKGFELEAQLEWQTVDVYAAYSYTESEQDVSSLTANELAALYLFGPANMKSTYQNQLLTDGAPLSATPKHLASVWFTYRADEWLPGFKFGAGIRHVGETYDGSRGIELANGQVLHNSLTTESFELLDLMLGYRFKQFELSLNIDNLTDKTVITSCLARGDCFYGQRRTVTANLKYRF
ncbi:TonB-dependent siderophore receptor [Pseudoalteromonas fenneropenaei]|uniref:TonB-dependent siderophore receptor n=1 Tax=Pseudoalteromonas fenneropenaei TaxID=1737459 RepID=A0ABV7CPY5_9GAMM